MVRNHTEAIGARGSVASRTTNVASQVKFNSSNQAKYKKTNPMWTFQNGKLIEQPSMAKPEYSAWEMISPAGQTERENKIKQYEQYVSSLRTLPVSPELKLVEGERYEENVHFKIEKVFYETKSDRQPLGKTGAKDMSHGSGYKEMAILIPEAKEEWVNIYGDHSGRFVLDETYGSHDEAIDKIDKSKFHVEAVRIFKKPEPLAIPIEPQGEPTEGLFDYETGEPAFIELTKEQFINNVKALMKEIESAYADAWSDPTEEDDPAEGRKFDAEKFSEGFHQEALPTLCELLYSKIIEPQGIAMTGDFKKEDVLLPEGGNSDSATLATLRSDEVTPIKGCGVCGSATVLIRGKYPGHDKREICPCCAYERLEQVNEISSPNYMKTYQNPTTK